MQYLISCRLQISWFSCRYRCKTCLVYSVYKSIISSVIKFDHVFKQRYAVKILFHNINSWIKADILQTDADFSRCNCIRGLVLRREMLLIFHKRSSSKIYLLFSNSLIIHQVRTKEIKTVKEVWKPGLN